MGGRAWVMVAAICATGCAGGAADSRGDGASLPAMTTSGGTSTGVDEVGTSSSESSGDVPVPTTSDELTGSTSTSSSGGEGSSGESEGSTGAPACGDGQLGADEVCDDGNPVDGDGCNVDCQPSGRLLWSDSYAGGSVLPDEALVVPEGPRRLRAPAGGVFPLRLRRQPEAVGLPVPGHLQAIVLAAERIG